MKNLNIEAKVREILMGQLGADESDITPTAHIVNDLGADSIGQVEITMALEDEFKIEISDAEAETMQTVGQIINFITNRIG